MNTESENPWQNFLRGFEKKTERERAWLNTNIWWLLPGAILIAFFGWGIWFQSNYAVNTARVHLELPRINSSINLVYPRVLKYGDSTPVPLDISLSCTMPCDLTPLLVTFRTGSGLLMAEKTDAVDWGNLFSVRLIPNGTPKRLFIQQGSGQAGNVVVDIRADVYQTQFTGISIESGSEAVRRLAATELWTRSTIAIGILTALVGWLLKQRDDDIKTQKENLDKITKSREALLDKVKISQSLGDWLKEYDALASKNSPPKEFGVVKKALEELVNNRQDDVLTLLSRDFNKNFEAGKKAYDLLKKAEQPENPVPMEIASSARDFINELGNIIEIPDLKAAYNLLEKNRGKAAGLVFAVFKQYPEKASEFFETEYPSLSKQASENKKSTFLLPYLRAHYGGFTSNWYRVLYSLENYPLESLLLRCSWELEENLEDQKVLQWIKEYWGPENEDIKERWLRPLSPFFDERNPLHVEKKPSIDPDFEVKYFNPDTDLGFKKDDDRHFMQSMLFLAQTPWEIRACVAAYCRTQPVLQKDPGDASDNLASNDHNKPDDISPFFVYLQPSWFDLEQATAESAVLHALASQWIDVLALNYYSYVDLENDQRQRLSQLLLWHASTLPNLRAMLEESFEESKSKPGKPDSSYIYTEILNDLNGASRVEQTPVDLESFISMRPKGTTHTVLIAPAVSLTPGTGRELSLSHLTGLLGISDRLLEKKVIIKAFILKIMIDSLRTHIMTKEIIFSQKELETSCNRRFAYVFSGEENATETGFNMVFMPGSVPAEVLLVRKSQGSLGRMVWLGQKLIQQHARNSPDKKYISLKEIENL